MWPASLATLLLALVVGAGVLVSGPWVVALTLAVPMLALANGWVRLLHLPSPRGTTAMLAAGALIILASGLIPTPAQTTVLPSAIAVVLILEFVHQLGRRDRRPRLVESVSSAVFGIALISSGACFLLLDGPVGRSVSITVVAAVLTGCLADALRPYVVPRGATWVAALLASLLGATTGWGCWSVLEPLPAGQGMLWAVAGGAVAGLVSFTLRLALAGLPTIGGFRARWAAGSAALLVVGAVAYGMAWGIHGSLAPLLTGLAGA